MTVFKNLVHPEFDELRTVEIDGEPWFVGKDVAAALGYTNSRDAIATHVFADDKGGVEKNLNEKLNSGFGPNARVNSI